MHISETKLRNALLISIIILLIPLVVLIAYTNSFLTIETLEKEAIASFEIRDITINDLGNRNIEILIPINQEKDYDPIVNQYIKSLNEYKHNKTINIITIRLINYDRGTETEYKLNTLEFY